MCGIVGFVGQGKVSQVLLNGLEKLEYRGYDSAGVYLMDDQGHAQLFKCQGRIEKLKQLVDESFEATMGIGHTRWATHGPAVAYNAHPHLSPQGRFAIVHNGVIENFQELKAKLIAKDQLKSDTDTEVIVALIEQYVLQGESTWQAFGNVLQEIKGSYAFGLMDQKDPSTLYAAKNKSPLLIGLGQGFNLITSDAMATIDLTHDYLEIKDGDLVRLMADEVKVETLAGEEVSRSIFKAEFDAEDLGKGGYPHYMAKEIAEQPAVIRRNLQAYLNESGGYQFDSGLLQAMRASDRLYIVACGTSYHAGLIGKEVFESLTQIPVEVHIASEFSYHLPLLSERPFFIFISQSGETADSRQALVKVKELNLPSLAITNVKGSTLARESTYQVSLNAGVEIAVASTKAYIAQVTVLILLAAAIAEASPADFAQQLSLAGQAIEAVLSEQETIHQWVQTMLSQADRAFYIGRYLDERVAREAALKLKEISYIQTEAFAAGELKHGTIALIEEGTPVVALVSDPATAYQTLSNLQEVKARGARTLVITTEELSQGEDEFIIPNVPVQFAPLVLAVVGQLIAYYATLDRGLDIDKPRNLAKSVTVE